MTKEEFINKQKRIYKEIQTDANHLSKLTPIAFHNQGGYIVALRHSDDVVEAIEKFNDRIEKMIPIMKYDRTNLHTTMATFQVQDHFEPDENMLDRMLDVLKGRSLTCEPMEIGYREYLLDRSAIILAGEFCEGFYVNSTNLISALQDDGFQFKYPWGTHITACRFKEKGSLEQIREIQAVIAESQINLTSVPKQIDVGYYRNDGERFELCVYESLSCGS